VTREGVARAGRLPYRDLRSARLLLRRPQAGDAELVFRAFSADAEVTRYLAWPPHETLADAEVALAARLQRLADGREYSWTIERAASGEVIGIVSAWHEADAIELGFVLARSCWGGGLATEATIAVKDWALASPGVARVWATCDAENLASARVLAKAGLANRGPFAREIVRPNLGPQPRPSLLFEATAGP
jgi:RimJ/RimL family protein N-acetyltransferase